MDNVTDNGASDMNTIKNKDRTSAMTPQDCEELKSSTVTREIAFATKPLSKEETRDAFHEMIAAAMRGDDASSAAPATPSRCCARDCRPTRSGARSAEGCAGSARSPRRTASSSAIAG